MSERTLFISDCHLQEADPNLSQQFIDFLQTEARKAKALYILGDLFDYWLGDDEGIPRFHNIVSALKELSLQTSLYFIHGNRDYLIGQAFATASGCQLLQQPTLLTLDDIRVVILHGDTLCTDDRVYQYYRKCSHQAWLQKIFLRLGLGLRQKIYRSIYTINTRQKKKASPQIMDVSETAVSQLAQTYGAAKIIHGHTHRPKRHAVQGQDSERIVLGDWQTNPNYVCFEKQHFNYICP